MPLIMGIDVAGEVAALGADVTGWQIGDRVMVDPINRKLGKLLGETMDGGSAEQVKVSAAQLLRLPDDVSFEAAAALPVAYGTAYRMMVDARQDRGRREGADPRRVGRRRHVLRPARQARRRARRRLRVQRGQARRA